MPYCAAYNCRSRHSNKLFDSQNRKVTFHRFPHGDEERLKEWLVQLRRKDYYPSKKAVLCSKHFEDKFMYRFSAAVRLREGAVPTIFDFPPHKKTKEKPASPIYTINTRSGKRFSGKDGSGKDSTSTEKTPTVKMKQKNKISRDETSRKNKIQKDTGSDEANYNGLVNKAENQKVSQLNSVPTASVVKKRRGRKILMDDPPSPTSNVTAEPTVTSNIATSKEEAVVKVKQPRRRKILREDSPPPPPDFTPVHETRPGPVPPSKEEAVVKVKQPRRRKILREDSPPPPPDFTPVHETPPVPVPCLADTSTAPVHYDGKDVLEYITVSRAARKRKAQIFVDHSYAITESPKELKQKLLDVTASLVLTKKKLKGAYQCNTRLKRRLSTLVLFIDSLKNAEKHSNTFELLDDLETLMLDEPWVKS